MQYDRSWSIGLPDNERIRKQKIRDSNNHAYTLQEVAEMMDKVPEPARTVCAVAAFTGLSRSELRGLKWGDYDGENIKVQRKVWNTVIGAPKTEAREATTYVIPLLQKILKKYKEEYPEAVTAGYFVVTSCCAHWIWTICLGVKSQRTSTDVGSAGILSGAG